MEAGSLRQRITLQSADPSGWVEGSGVAPGAADLATVWAELRNARYSRAFGASVVDPDDATVFSIRWFSAFQDVSLVTWGREAYQVEAVVDPDGRRRELELLCRRVSS